MPLPRTVHLSSIVLPAAGVYLAADATSGGVAGYTPAEIPDNCPWLLFELEYTPVGGTGRPSVFVEYTTRGGSALRCMVADSMLAVSAPTASRQVYLEDVVLQAPSTGAGVAYVYGIPYKVDRGAVVARLAVAEAGDTGSPGTVRAWVTGGYGS